MIIQTIIGTIVVIILSFLVVIIAVHLFFEIVGLLISEDAHSINNRNHLFKCSECGRFQRRYQLEFAKIATGSKPFSGSDDNYAFGCVYCDTYQTSKSRETERAWTSHHADCPKIAIRPYLKSFFVMKKAEKTRQEIAELKEFEEYNNISVDENWIQKLTKDLENSLK